MDMRLKRAVVQCTLAFMVVRDVQNTEGDYEMVREFIEKIRCSSTETGDCLFDATMVQGILNPLWDYYMSNLHDGYNVTTPGKEA